MKLAEIFYSVQGEGQLAGVPSVFIRFAGCNLRCTWCDAKHASWHPESEEWTEADVLREVEKYNTRHCVITGGEPGIHPELASLSQRLRATGRHITIETNDTRFQAEVACDLASISPKLEHSIADPAAFPGESALQRERRWNLDAFRGWLDHYEYQLKFVLCTAADVLEIQELVRLIDRKILPDRILLMPEGTDPKTIRSRSAEVVRLCKQHGYRYCCRLQLDLFGNARGT